MGAISHPNRYILGYCTGGAGGCGGGVAAAGRLRAGPPRTVQTG